MGKRQIAWLPPRLPRVLARNPDSDANRFGDLRVAVRDAEAV